jgi:retron-type reverse transcriptase
MALGKIEAIIGALQAERYRWTPVRRTYIEKKNSSKKRPLGTVTTYRRGATAVTRLMNTPAACVHRDEATPSSSSSSPT